MIYPRRNPTATKLCNVINTRDFVENCSITACSLTTCWKTGSNDCGPTSNRWIPAGCFIILVTLVFIFMEAIINSRLTTLIRVGRTTDIWMTLFVFCRWRVSLCPPRCILFSDTLGSKVAFYFINFRELLLKPLLLLKRAPPIPHKCRLFIIHWTDIELLVKSDQTTEQIGLLEELIFLHGCNL